jgi:MoxR-like ATPase
MRTDPALKRLLESISRVIVGKDGVIELAVAALLARGHLLIEDRPGLGKTMLARAIAQSLGATFHRIQCTPDLLPSDVTGVSIYRPGREVFEFVPGPVFTQVLLVDEINRTTPRTQSALLEAMEERQVSVEGDPRPLPEPFFVVATQNPVELTGTFPLPEAQIDRFLVRLELGYPRVEEETEILAAQIEEHPIESVTPVLGAEALADLQGEARRIPIAPALLRYISEISAATRRRPDVHLGVSPRGSLALMRLAQAFTLLRGEGFVTPDTIRHVAPAALAHRLVLASRRRAGGSAAEVVAEVLDLVPVPTGSAPAGDRGRARHPGPVDSGSGSPGTAWLEPESRGR